MRRNIVAGNWKMNNDLPQTEALLQDLKKHVVPDNVSVMVAPTFVNLYHAFESVREYSVEVIAQDMHQAKSGAFTGEVSAAMLKSVGVKTTIIGHSERRAMFWETNEILALKVNAALENDMTSVFCFGEELEDRKSGNHFNIVKEQLEEGLFHVKNDDFKNIILAYEPVWAIGTGETASPEQAQEMHKYVRGLVTDAYTNEIAENVSILYGGSVKPANAKEIFANPDVDGGLIGGAALKAEDFMAIVNSF